jgi:hypothetical protein
MTAKVTAKPASDSDFWRTVAHDQPAQQAWSVRGRTPADAQGRASRSGDTGLSLLLPEDLPVVFGNEFSGKETEQRDDSNGECQPIETCIEWNAKHSTCKRKDCTHNSLIEQVWKEQDEEQTTYSAEKERFTP